MFLLLLLFVLFLRREHRARSSLLAARCSLLAARCSLLAALKQALRKNWVKHSIDII